MYSKVLTNALRLCRIDSHVGPVDDIRGDYYYYYYYYCYYYYYYYRYRYYYYNYSRVMLLLPFVVCLSPVVYGVVVVSSMPLRMLLRSITAFTVYVSWCSLLLLLLRGSFCTLTHMSVLDCGITGDASHGFCSGVADVLQSPYSCTATLSHRLTCRSRR